MLMYQQNQLQVTTKQKNLKQHEKASRKMLMYQQNYIPATSK